MELIETESIYTIRNRTRLAEWVAGLVARCGPVSGLKLAAEECVAKWTFEHWEVAVDNWSKCDNAKIAQAAAGLRLADLPDHITRDWLSHNG